MGNTAELLLEGKSWKLPIIEGTENEKSVDISSLRSNTGYITLDDGYANTGSCQSKITFIDGEKGILRYRGIPIEELAERSTFIEVAHLLIMGWLPTSAQLRRFSDLLTDNELLDEAMKHHFEGFPVYAHPMAILSSMINASSCFYPELLDYETRDHFEMGAARLLSQVRTIAAFAYRKSRGLPSVYPKPNLKYTANFLHMMFSLPYSDYELKPEAIKALELIFMLHADHEQNCSTATVRMVASSHANLFASAAAGVCALWGPLHGGANQAVLEMLEEIHKSGDDGSKFIAAAKDKNSGKRLMGFGHRVYKNYDPGRRSSNASAMICWTNFMFRTRCWTLRSVLKRRLCTIPISSSASSIPTSIFTAASSCGPLGSRWRCSPSSSPSDACRAGSPTIRRSWNLPPASIGPGRSIPGRP
jgi:citrate synthase